MKVCKQAEHCAYMVRLIADRCAKRASDENTTGYEFAGTDFEKSECMGNHQLHEQIVAARRELLELDRAILERKW